MSGIQSCLTTFLKVNVQEGSVHDELIRVSADLISPEEVGELGLVCEKTAPVE